VFKPTLTVTPGQLLYVTVGGMGNQYRKWCYNGGGSAPDNRGQAGGGGGASDIRIGGTRLAIV